MKQVTNIPFITLQLYNDQFGSTLVRHNLSYYIWIIFDKIYRILESANIR